MSMLSRRLLIGPVLLVLLVAVGYPIFWFFTARSMENGFARWRDARAAEGYKIEHGESDVGGFPFALRLSIAEPRVESTADGWRWATPGIVFDMQPWNWRWFRLDAPGPHTLDVVLRDRWHQVQAETASAFVIGRLNDKGGLDDAALEIKDLRFQTPSSGNIVTIRDIRARMQRADTAGTTPGGEGVDLSVAATATNLGAKVKTPLGSTIERLSASGTIRPAPPRWLNRAAIEAWRGAGGVIDLSALQLNWGPLDLSGGGTLTVDADMRPLGALTGVIRGYRKTLTAFERAGMIRRNHAAASRIALDLMSRRAEDGGGRVVTVPMTAQNGALFIGPVRLLKLPPIPFPVPSAGTIPPGPSR